MNFKKMTVEKATEKIKKIESANDVYQICVIERKLIKKDFKKCFKRHHLHNKEGKRIYYKTESLYYTFAENKEKEGNKIVIDSFIEIGHHSYFSLSGKASKEYTHNIYYLVVEKLEPNNKTKRHLISTKKTEYEYKEGELTEKQRRFIL